MGNVLPIVIIVIASLLIMFILLMLTIWEKIIELKLKRKFGWKQYAFLIQWIIGLSIVIAAALIAFDADIWGEGTLRFAKIIGAIGLCLIISSFLRFLPHDRLLP